jgi:hypothetical protein
MHVEPRAKIPYRLDLRTTSIAAAFVTAVEASEGGEGRYRHFDNGTIYWHRNSDVIVFEKITVCYEDEKEDLIGEMLKKFVSKIRKPKASIFDFLKSDPLGLDPQEDPDAVAWVGNGGCGQATNSS